MSVISRPDYSDTLPAVYAGDAVVTAGSPLSGWAASGAAGLALLLLTLLFNAIRPRRWRVVEPRPLSIPTGGPDLSRTP